MFTACVQRCHVRGCVFMPYRFAEIRHEPQADPVAATSGAVSHPTARAAAGIVLLGAMLAACSTSGDTSFSLFTEPGKYQYYTCPQIATEMKRWTGREHELKALMDRADQSAGGAAGGLIAYKDEYVAAGEELH